MKKKTIGLLTIGQSPRHDITGDLDSIFADKLDYTEAGALDGLSLDEVHAMAPQPGDHFLVTRMADGTMVHIAARRLTDLMQRQVTRLEQSGVFAILILCTEGFAPFTCSIPVIYPNDVLKAQVSAAAVHGHIGVILPDRDQVSDFAAAWESVVPRVDATFGSPYAGDCSLEDAAKYFAGSDVDLIVLDCMGYTAAMAQIVSETAGKPIFLAKTLAAEFLTAQIDE